MCLQDYQLARSEYIETYEFAPSGVITAQLLPRNESRTRLLIVGPSAGNLDILVGIGNSRRSLIRLTSTTAVDCRSFDITRHGYALTLPLFYTASAAMTFTVFEYSLPLDLPQLERLAKKGQW